MTHLLSRLWHKFNVKIVCAITHLDLPRQLFAAIHNHSLREEHTVLLLGSPPSDVCAHRSPPLCGPPGQAKSQFKRRSTANNVEIHIPVPTDADSPKFKTTVGSVKWIPENSEIIWSIKSFPVRLGSVGP